MCTLISCVVLFYLGAARTYFKSLKSHEKRRLSGKAMACAAEGRKRQRRHNVSSFHVSSLSMIHTYRRLMLGQEH